MTREAVLAASVLAFCSASPAVSTAARQVQVRDHFQPMAFLVGSCWIGTFPDGKMTDEHCFEWVFGGHYIRDRHVVRGSAKPYEGESLYAWDPGAKRVAFWYWNSNGGVSTGHVEPGPEGLVFPEKHTTAAGVQEMKAVWAQTSQDAYRITQSRRTDGGGWTVAWTMDMKRKGPSTTN